MRKPYQVRVREQIGPHDWVKKSKFYNANSSEDAARMYKGPGTVIYSEKVKKERLLGGVGEFFALGDSLLRDFAKESELERKNYEKTKERVRTRRSYLSKLKRLAIK